MKIAVLADSHGASLKLGWEMIAPLHKDIELRFFAQRRDGLADLRAQPGRLVPMVETLRSAFRFTSGGLEAVEISDFDAILVYGLCAAPFYHDVSEFYSQQLLDLVCRDLVADRLSLHIVTQAQLAGAPKIYVGHDPLPLEGSLMIDRPRQHYLDGLNTLNKTVYHSLGARIIPQPMETTTGGSCTLKRFTNDARRLSIGDELDNQLQPKEDPYRHMNAEFGALWLSSFFHSHGSA